MLLALGILWLSGCGVALATPPIEAAAVPDGGLALGSRASFLRDTDGTLDLAGARAAADAGRFRATTAERLNFGFISDAVWLRFRLASAGDVERLMLRIDYPLLASAELYLPGVEGDLRHQRSGLGVPVSERAFPRRLPVFAIPLPVDGERVAYLRVESFASLQVPARLYTPAGLDDALTTRNLLVGMYYGIFVALALYNLCLLCITRDRNYFWYLMAVIPAFLIALGFNGIGALYFWPERPQWSVPLIIAFVGLASVAITQFSRVLLDLGERMPGFDRVLVGLILAVTVATAAMVANAGNRALAVYGEGLVAVVVPVLMTAAIVSLRGGYPPARFFTLGWGLFFIGPLLMSLDIMGVVPSTVISRYGIQVGSSLEMILFSLALGDRLRWLRDEQERIQRETARMLETRVSERTDELNAALVELSASNRQLERITRVDPLTGVQNRRGLEEAISRAWHRSRLRAEPLSLLMVDLDHFKEINDSRGHAFGDAVLSEVAELIVASVRREVDTVARYGGEEFVVIMPGTDFTSAYRRAERIRAAAEYGPFAPGSDTPAHLTLSIGVATASASADADDETPHELLERADQALYEAKQRGRNQTLPIAG